MSSHKAFRVMLDMRVPPELAAGFESAWLAGAQLIAQEDANIGQWLSRSDDEADRYYIVSDWVDEPSFRAYERSERHRQHRERLHPYRTSGSMSTMDVVHVPSTAQARP
jgi:heme oxygenase (mycobilin-producing)